MERTLIGRVYVWELPVRFYHWVNAVCVVALSVTGYLIGTPLAVASASEASYSYWFGIIRFIHFVAAFVFFFNFVFRIYWGFVGNQFAGGTTSSSTRRSNSRNSSTCSVWTYFS